MSTEATHAPVEAEKSCWGCKKSTVLKNDLYCTKSGRAQILKQDIPCEEHKDLFQ